MGERLRGIKRDGIRGISRACCCTARSNDVAILYAGGGDGGGGGGGGSLGEDTGKRSFDRLPRLARGSERSAGIIDRQAKPLFPLV